MAEHDAEQKQLHYKNHFLRYIASGAAGLVSAFVAAITTIHAAFWEDIKNDPDVTQFRKDKSTNIETARANALKKAPPVAPDPITGEVDPIKLGAAKRSVLGPAIRDAKEQNQLAQDILLERKGYRSIGFWRKNTVGVIDRFEQMGRRSRGTIMLNSLVAGAVTAGGLNMFLNNYAIASRIKDMDKKHGKQTDRKDHLSFMAKWDYFISGMAGLISGAVASTLTVHNAFWDDIKNEPEVKAFRKKKKETINTQNRKATEHVPVMEDPIAEGSAKRHHVNAATLESKVKNAKAQDRLLEGMGYRSIGFVRKFTVGTMDRFQQLSRQSRSSFAISAIISAGIAGGGVHMFINNNVMSARTKELQNMLDAKEAERQNQR